MLSTYATFSLNSIYFIIGIPILNTKHHKRFMLGSGTKFDWSIRLFSSVRYCILPGAVWCGAVHTFSHTRTMILILFHTWHRNVPSPDKMAYQLRMVSPGLTGLPQTWIFAFLTCTSTRIKRKFPCMQRAIISWKCKSSINVHKPIICSLIGTRFVVFGM